MITAARRFFLLGLAAAGSVGILASAARADGTYVHLRIEGSAADALRALSGFVPLSAVDEQFTVTAFGLTNAGIGAAVVRLLRKLRSPLP